MENKDLNEELLFEYSKMNNESLECLFGLNFPVSATAFQKAVLVLAPLMAALRQSVLSGIVINDSLCEKVRLLGDIIGDGKGIQK